MAGALGLQPNASLADDLAGSRSTTSMSDELWVVAVCITYGRSRS